MVILRRETNRSLSEAKHLYESAGFVEVEPFNNEPLCGTIGSRKISDTSNSDAYAPQRTAADAPSGSRFQRSLLIRLWRGNSARLIDADYA